jgi:hypothetical protein
MRRWIAVALIGGALGFAGAAAAASPSHQEWTMGLFALGGGSTDPTGIVRDAPSYGGLTIGPICCQLSLDFERVFNAEVMRGTVSGTIVVGGSPDGTVWRGALHGRLTPSGMNGHLVVVEEGTGRRFVGTWSTQGHPDQGFPHFLGLDVEGELHE